MSQRSRRMMFGLLLFIVLIVIPMFTIGLSPLAILLIFGAIVLVVLWPNRTLNQGSYRKSAVIFVVLTVIILVICFVILIVLKSQGPWLPTAS